MTIERAWHRPALLCFCVVALAACSKKAHQPAASAAPADAPATVATASSPAEPSADAVERAHKQLLLDYATMEDGYINDAHAQWASSAKASSTFGETATDKPADSNMAKNAVGPVDGNSWTNNNQNIGFDWLEADFAKPVHASEIRVVFQSGEGVEAVSKVELGDGDGHWTQVWSGLSDVKADSRGQRSWFVKTFDKTTSLVKAVKVTIANNVQPGYKVVDAVQLVGDP
jgi:hypothetical protein